MAKTEAERWNRRYLSDDKFISPHPAPLLADHIQLLPTHGLALDIAMGLGGNSKLLYEHGLRVIGIDISDVAVMKAKKTIPGLMGVIADIQNFYIPENRFEVIVDILYLQRNIWDAFIRGLKPGGILLLECLTEEMLSVSPSINPEYLVKSGELKQVFSEGMFASMVETLFFEESWFSTISGHNRISAGLIVRRMF
jgi:tellurite methyltransferase